MRNRTDRDDDEIAERNLFGEDLADAIVDVFDADALTDDRTMGYSGWVAYWPDTDRACAVINGDPAWFDATSIEDAIDIAESGDYES